MTNKDRDLLQEYHYEFLWDEAKRLWLQRREPEVTDEIEVIMRLNLKNSWMKYDEIFILDHFRLLIDFISAETGEGLKVPPEVQEVLRGK